MKKTSFVSLFSLFVLCTLPLSLNAQITITSSDIQKPVGYQFSTESTDYGSHPVDLGTTGGPQTWDFSSYTTPNLSNTEVVNTSSTPFASNFPTANFCMMLVDEGSMDEAYAYNRVESNMWTFQGMGFDLPETSFVYIWDPMGEIPLPITMGSSWVWETGLEYQNFGVTTTIEQRDHATVDAYGTMILPSGTASSSFEVLRIVSYDTTVTTITGPFPISITTTFIDYSWISTDPYFVASATSQEDETNPNFTTAAWISRASGPSGIGKDGGGEVKIPQAFRLEQNAPNPFNPRTDIAFTVSEELEGSVDLAVFTIRGERVRTLASGKKAPGDYIVSWDGRNDQGEALPSGVYLYRLISGGESQTRKMMLAK